MLRGPNIGAPVETSDRRQLSGWIIVRAWSESERTRVMVYFRDRDEIESHIATALLNAGDSWVVDESRKFGGAPVTIVTRDSRKQ